MDEPVWQVVEGTGPLVATSLHSGRDIREEVLDLMAIRPDDKLIELLRQALEATVAGVVKELERL